MSADRVPRTAFASTSFDYHPYQCGGKAAGCLHCRRELTDDHVTHACGLCMEDEFAEDTEEGP